MKKTIFGFAAMLMLVGATAYAGNGKTNKSGKTTDKSCVCSKECCKDCGSKDCTCCPK